MKEFAEEIGRLNVQHLRGIDASVVVDVEDLQSIGEGGDAEHVQQSGL